MPMTTYGDISPRVGQFAEVEMLAHAAPIIITEKLAQTKPMPANKGQLISFRRAVPWAPATTPVTEGVTPASQQLTYENVTASLNQYGAWAELTDVIVDTHEDPVLKTMIELSAEQMAETREILNWGVISSGTNVIYAGGATAAANVDSKLTKGDIRLAVRTLRGQRARMKTKMLDSSVNMETKPIERAYVALGHTNLEQDIRDMQGFIPVAEYGSKAVICPDEIGAVENVRFVLSPHFDPQADAGAAAATNGMLSTGGTNTDLYSLVIMGEDSWATVPLRGKDSVKPMVLNPNTPRGGDPMGQRGSVAWKMWHCALILNEAFMIKIVAGASEL